MKVGWGACGEFKRSASREISLGVERDVDRAAKEGGRFAADEIELKADEEGEYENEVSP
jgi:hypothetical protein